MALDLRVINFLMLIRKTLFSKGMGNDIPKTTETMSVLFDWQKEIFVPFPFSLSLFSRDICGFWCFLIYTYINTIGWTKI